MQTDSVSEITKRTHLSGGRASVDHTSLSIGQMLGAFSYLIMLVYSEFFMLDSVFLFVLDFRVILVCIYAVYLWLISWSIPYVYIV